MRKLLRAVEWALWKLDLFLGLRQKTAADIKFCYVKCGNQYWGYPIK